MNNTEYTDSCHQDYESAPFCYTRVRDPVYNNSRYDSWGYCSPNCTGQRTGPNSAFNLASKEFHQVWEANLYDLGSYGAGYCYTYNPPNESMSGTSKGLGIFFKQISAGIFLSYNMYLHEKGQFWPNTELQPIGQTEKIILEDNMEISGKFSIQYRIKMRKKEDKCERDENYKFTDCVSNYIATTVGCKVD